MGKFLQSLSFVVTPLVLLVASAKSMKQYGQRKRLRSNSVPRSMHPQEVSAFPSVFTAQVSRKDLISAFYKDALGEMDLLHVQCEGDVDDIASSCQISSLFHSKEELAYFKNLLPEALYYDADATDAVVLSPVRHLQAAEDQRIDNEDDRDAQEVASFYNSSTVQNLFSVGYSRIAAYSCYLNYYGTIQWLQDLAANAPPHLSLELLDIGDSYTKTQKNTTGHDIYALKVSSSLLSARETLQKKAPLLLLTGMHPREYAPPEMVRRWIHGFLDPYDLERQTILESTDIYWIPYVNPDGRILAEDSQLLAEDSQLFRRKNLNREASGALSCRNDEYGVDLNRNFPFRWGLDGGSSSRACRQTFRGASPGSEPEIQAVVTFAKSIFPVEQRLPANNFDVDRPVAYNESETTGIFLDIHAFGNYYIYPWGFENSATPNHEGLAAMTSKLNHFTDYAMRGPGVQYSGEASGASDDWAYGALGAAGMTWELGTSFHQDCDTFNNDIVNKNLAALTYAAKLAARPYRLSKGPDVFSLVASTLVLEADEDITISVGASDFAFSNQALDAAAQDIKSILIFLDRHPYANMSARSTRAPDWTMEQSQLDQGTGSMTWTFTSLKAYWTLHSRSIEGPHTFYFVAVDSDGYQGPISSLLVEVASLPTDTPSVSLNLDFSAGMPSTSTTPKPSSNIPSDSPSLLPSATPSTAPTVQLGAATIVEGGGGSASLTAPPSLPSLNLESGYRTQLTDDDAFLPAKEDVSTKFITNESSSGSQGNSSRFLVSIVSAVVMLFLG